MKEFLMFKRSLMLIIGGLLISATIAQAGPKPPFLILDMMPHLTGTIKGNWDNAELNLNDEQKPQLLKIREETIKAVTELKKKIAPLEQEVADRILAGATPEELSRLVDEIAGLKAAATKVHLKCIYETKKVLTPEQYAFVISL